MKVIGLNGREYNIKLVDKKRKDCSSLHKKARTLIRNMFPFEVFYEELTLHGTRTSENQVLFADFLSPRLRLIIEVHGKQHYEYSAHHHTNRAGFAKHKRRDSVKSEWAALNSFTLIELPYNESEEEWRLRIKNWNNI